MLKHQNASKIMGNGEVECIQSFQKVERMYLGSLKCYNSWGGGGVLLICRQTPRFTTKSVHIPEHYKRVML